MPRSIAVADSFVARPPAAIPLVGSHHRSGQVVMDGLLDNGLVLESS